MGLNSIHITFGAATGDIFYIFVQTLDPNLMQRFLLSLWICLLASALSPLQAQFGYAAEYGFFAGPVFMQGDYGARESMSSRYANNGIGVGAYYYLNFAFNNSYNYSGGGFFSEHFKLRAEASFIYTNNKHEGKYVDGDKNSLMAQQLRAMHGSSSVVDLGLQLEFYPRNLVDFTNTVGALSPYVSLGIHGNYFMPRVVSDLGKLNTPLTTPEKYYGGISNNAGFTYSVTASLGLRYRLNESIDLMADGRFQYFFTDWIDGLSPNPILYPENRFNDTMVWLNFGYVYYFE